MTETKQPRAFRITPDSPSSDAPVLIETADPFDTALPEAETAPTAKGWRIGLWGVFVAALGAFLSLAIGLWGVRLVEEMIAANPLLGWLAASLGAVALMALLLLALREWLIIRRLASVEKLRNAAKIAYAADDRDAARGVAASLITLLAAENTEAGRELQGHAKAIIDGSDLLKISERLMLVSRDAEAERLIAGAARRVSVVTAISPRAWVDVLFVLAQSVRLIRGIAVIYGGRPGGLGGLRLFRRVLSHLALTGGVAMTDSLLSQVVGAGLAARLSAKLGEGVLNGVLTARVGLAAIEVCRPLPFLAAMPPNLSAIAAGLLRRGE